MPHANSLWLLMARISIEFRTDITGLPALSKASAQATPGRVRTALQRLHGALARPRGCHPPRRCGVAGAILMVAPIVLVHTVAHAGGCRVRPQARPINEAGRCDGARAAGTEFYTPLMACRTCRSTCREASPIVPSWKIPTPKLTTAWSAIQVLMYSTSCAAVYLGGSMSVFGVM